MPHQTFFFGKLYLFGAVSHEPAPYLVIESKDGIELIRGQLHSLQSDKRHQGMRERLEVQAIEWDVFVAIISSRE